VLTTEEPARAVSRLRWAWQLLGVALAGGAGLLVDVSVLWILAVELDVPRAAAAATSYTVSGVVVFLLNRSVFGARGGDVARHGRRFLALFAFNLVVTTLLVPLLAGGFDGALSPDASLLLAKAITVLGLLLGNTVLYRTWVFTGDATADGGER
jgi:putative flippase GtrA